MNKKKLIIIITSILVLVVAIVLSIVLLNKKDNEQGALVQSFIENRMLTSLAEMEKMDKTKPVIVLFYADYCKTCHEFMPVFKQMARDRKKDYNFATLNIDDPANYPLVAGNVAGIPSLYIFDFEIGNKIYLSLRTIPNYEYLLAEVDRYSRIRSYIDIDAAKKAHEERMQTAVQKLQEKAEKQKQ